MQLLQNCIGPTIRIGREIQCLPYAGFFSFFWQSDGASWWMVCYQRGLPRLVSIRCSNSKSLDHSILYFIYIPDLFPSEDIYAVISRNYSVLCDTKEPDYVV